MNAPMRKIIEAKAAELAATFRASGTAYTCRAVVWNFCKDRLSDTPATLHHKIINRVIGSLNND